MIEYSPDIPLKRCSHCHQMIPATKEFFSTASTKDGFHNMCKVCNNKRTSERAVDHKFPTEGTIKKCSKCKESKPATTEYFPSHRRSVDHLYYLCKECKNAPKRKPPKYVVPKGYKRCPQCGENKPATANHYYQLKSGRMSNYCKPCSQQRNRNRRPAVNPQITHKTCKKCGNEYPVTSQYFSRSKTGVNGFLASCKKCKSEASHISWFRKKEIACKLFKKVRITRREKRAVYHRLRQARKKAIPGSHTPEQIQEQYKRQKGKCYYCSQKVKWGEHHVDHTFPLSRASGDDPINDISYLVIACPTCNMRKGNKYPWEWPEGGRLF